MSGRRPGAPNRRTPGGVARPPPTEKKKKETVLQRLEQGRKRTDAALMIQRAWNRYYISAARRRRHDAARKIQWAWGSSVMRQNAREELAFRRWLRCRREAVRSQWQRLCVRLQQRRAWALCIITAAKNVFIWRRRVVSRRLNRHAVRIQRWFRRQMHLLRTRGHMLWCMEAMEYMKSERCIRGNLLRLQRTAFMVLQQEVKSSLKMAEQQTWRRWVLEHRLYHHLAAVEGTQEAADVNNHLNLGAPKTRGDAVTQTAHLTCPVPMYTTAPERPATAKERPSSAFLRQCLRNLDDGASTTLGSSGIVPQRPASASTHSLPSLRSKVASPSRQRFVIAVATPSARMRQR